jgi:hypothetical protein
MFGVIRGQGFQTGVADRRALMGHVCGLCLTLARHTGQVSRLTTNYDAALLSVLYAALRPEQVTTVLHYCPLRAGVKGRVIAENPGTRFAAAIALLSASVKIEDHVQDRDTWLTRFAWPFRWLARQWKTGARHLASRLGFRTAVVEDQAVRQTQVEAVTTTDFGSYARPTEEAVGAACAHIGVIAACPERVPTLRRLGQLFGRIMYLVDAYQDYERDKQAGHFNPLARCFAKGEMRQQSIVLFRAAHAELIQRLEELRLPDSHLAKRLLIVQLAHVGKQTFASMGVPGEEPQPFDPSLPPLEGEPPPEEEIPPGAQPPLYPVPPAATGSTYNTCDACCDLTYCGIHGVDCCSSTGCSSSDCSAPDCSGADCGSCDCNCN